MDTLKNRLDELKLEVSDLEQKFAQGQKHLMQLQVLLMAKKMLMDELSKLATHAPNGKLE